MTEVRSDRPAWPVIFALKASGTAYKGRPDMFKAVVGSVDLEAFRGVQEAAREAVVADVPLFGCPENLKGLKVGDRINVTHGSKLVEAVYDGYDYRRPKYPVSYTINGRRRKGRAEGVVGKAA